jgi:hypothetical protein
MPARTQMMLFMESPTNVMNAELAETAETFF